MKTYTIIAGVNGVGKSSLSGVLKAERSDLGYIIDVDKISIENSCSPIQAGKIALSKINSYINDNISFSQETTLSGHLTLKTIQSSKEKGYTVRLFYVGLNSSDESILRIKNRFKKGGHNINNSDVIRRYKKRFNDLIKILPFCDEVYFYDNENGFTVVGEYKNGELITYGEYKPLWLQQLISLI